MRLTLSLPASGKGSWPMALQRTESRSRDDAEILTCTAGRGSSPATFADPDMIAAAISPDDCSCLPPVLNCGRSKKCRPLVMVATWA